MRYSTALLASCTLACIIGVSSCKSHTYTPPYFPEDDTPADTGELPKGEIYRHELMEVMSPGLGAFLQRVDVKHVNENGAFHGFQIVAFNGDPAFWAGCELRIGDIVTHVNNTSIGSYANTFDVWMSLPTAKEIVVDYERNGEKHRFRIVIREDRDAPPEPGSKRNAESNANSASQATKSP